MAIKNWTVTAESTTSAAAREIYLHNRKHPNHRRTEGCVDVWGNKNHTLNIIRNCESYKLESAKRRRGGRPPTEAMEFVFTLPKGMRPTPEQWKSMCVDIIKTTAKTLDIDANELAHVCRGVVHQQQQDQGRKGSGDHLHLMIGKFTKSNVYLRDLQKKGVLYAMKCQFNQSVLNELGVSHLDYVADKAYKHQAKRKAPSWKVRAARQHEELTKAKANYKRVHDKVLSYCEKWLEAFQKEDQRQMNRQYNRIEKGIGELGAFQASETDDKWVNGLMAEVDKITTKIDEKSNKSALPKFSRRM